MKHLHSIFCLFILISFNLYSQSDLLGTWYLDDIIKDGVTHPNYFNDSTIFDIEFTSNPGDLPNTLSFNSGHGCNASNGSYNSTSNEITITISGTTQVDCLNPPYVIYEMLYYDELNYNNGLDSIHTYTITGDTNNETLTLTNPNNGNQLVFKKQAPTTLLVSTWWLYQIDIPGNPIIDIPDTEGPHINFTNSINTFPTIPEADGIGECEGFSTNYSVSFNGANNIDFGELTTTLGNCATQAYEGIYFGVLGTETSNYFEFEIVNEGSTLILTDLLGAKLIFGNVSLSLDEQPLESVNISLKQNPVDHQLKLILDDQLMTKVVKYDIYSVEGKLITASNLIQDSIDVEYLNSGIYFIRFKYNEAVKTIKFIKK